MNFLGRMASMLFGYTDFRAGLTPENSFENNVDEEELSVVPKNLNREMLYESFIPVDSIIFVSETNGMSGRALRDFAKKTVLTMKSLILKEPSCFDKFSDYRSKVHSAKQGLREALELRNKYFEADKSLIGRTLTEKRYNNLKSRFHEKPQKLYYEDEDEKYLQMVERLANTKYMDNGLYRALIRELKEFYTEKEVLPAHLVLDARMSLSLGGPIFIPGVLISLLRRLDLKNNPDVINNILPGILAPSRKLLLKMHQKSFVEKKSMVLNFLESCLRRKNDAFKNLIDKAFEERTRVLEMCLKGDLNMQEKLQALDSLQESEILKLIYVFKNINEADLRLRLDKFVVDAYSSLINNGGTSAKDVLHTLFE